MGIRILKGGMLTTVQDSGRPAIRARGSAYLVLWTAAPSKLPIFFWIIRKMKQFSNSLFLDQHWNLLPRRSSLSREVIFSHRSMERPVKMYTALYMHRGDILSFRGCRTGSRGYIAFSSYLEIPVVMGSRSTNIKCGLGGFKGRRLLDGDYISFRAKRRYLPYFLSRSLDLNEFDQDNITLRVIMGPQDDAFTAAGKETFLSSEYVVTSEFDRMGCRLEGPFIASKSTTDIISDGIAFGSVQVPSHGKPIILLADRQTTGGYAKIATVISVDIPKLVQRKTDHKVKFQAVTVEEAQELLALEAKEMNEFRHQIYQPCKEVLDCRLVAKRISKLFQ